LPARSAPLPGREPPRDLPGVDLVPAAAARALRQVAVVAVAALGPAEDVEGLRDGLEALLGRFALPARKAVRVMISRQPPKCRSNVLLGGVALDAQRVIKRDPVCHAP
jgi:hypothetical protein